MNARSQILFAWSGIIAPNVLFGGLLAAGFVPPLLPFPSADEIAAITGRTRAVSCFACC